MQLIIADFNFATKLNQITPFSFSPHVEHTHQVGSETFNAPELWTEHDHYNGVKADIFAAAITAFMLLMKCSPFRVAKMTDPYYKRLAHSKK